MITPRSRRSRHKMGAWFWNHNARFNERDSRTFDPVWWLKRKRRMRKPPPLLRALRRSLAMRWWGQLFDPTVPF